MNQNQKEKNKQYPVDKNRSRSTEREQSDFFRNEVVVTGYSTSGQWERFWLFLLVGLFSFLLLAWEAKAKPKERERERERGESVNERIQICQRFCTSLQDKDLWNRVNEETKIRERQRWVKAVEL